MKIDHLVMNVTPHYQQESSEVQNIRKAGLPYNVKKGKGTKGFRATNIWIGQEYFELITISNSDGGGWKKEWVHAYNTGQRGLICLMLDVNNLDEVVQRLQTKEISISDPEKIKIEFFFKLFSKTMPWQNSYLNFFENVPLQIGFQQLDSEKIRKGFEKYMVPNSSENNISGITQIHIFGNFTPSDFKMLSIVFEETILTENQLTVLLENCQKLIFETSKDYSVQVTLKSENNFFNMGTCIIENTSINSE
ncbi:transporter [Solibacillus sp. MA9]|uniref:Transporter n=1 Tax=Solibacillus palustris TaxID=2908203 RepID=A0ABS9UCA2_9BACL|nr:transporter [Solibacillus sp. MA9]MCH7321971.1 transporter [Solibacillus sp. MA9]